MFEQNTIIKSPASAAAWLRAVVNAYGSGGFVSFPKDCEEIVEHFAKVGVQISIDDANIFWNANSENLQSGWVGISIDCVAALDSLAEDIENGYCLLPRLQALRGTVTLP